MVSGSVSDVEDSVADVAGSVSDVVGSTSDVTGSTSVVSGSVSDVEDSVSVSAVVVGSTWLDDGCCIHKDILSAPTSSVISSLGQSVQVELNPSLNLFIGQGMQAVESPDEASVPAPQPVSD